LSDPKNNGAPATPNQGSGIVLLALVAAATGASFIPGAIAGLFLSQAMGLTSDQAIGLTAVTVLISGAGAITLGVWTAGKLTNVKRQRSRFAATIAGGEAGLILGILIAQIGGALGAAAMVVLTGLGALLADSIFLSRQPS
jgi:hypothetical protein